MCSEYSAFLNLFFFSLFLLDLLDLLEHSFPSSPTSLHTLSPTLEK